MKGVLDNRGAAGNAEECAQGEVTEDVAPDSVCGQAGAGSNSMQHSKAHENNEKAGYQAWPFEHDIRARPPLYCL